MFAALSSLVYRVICPPGLQAEGLFYRNPGPPVSHGGGLLEDGVGVEVPFNRYAHRTQREGAGTVRRSRKSTGWRKKKKRAELHILNSLFISIALSHFLLDSLDLVVFSDTDVKCRNKSTR